MGRRILVVDDEADIREIVKVNLEREGYQVLTAASGLDGLRKAERERPDLVVLDIMMDGVDGIEVCRQLKQGADTSRIPVIFLTAKGTEVDKVVGLELGADDYVAKPFGIRELVARVKAVLRRGGPGEAGSATGSIRHEGLELNLESKRANVDGAPAGLTRTEWELLHLFMANPGRVFTRAQIKDRVWGEETYIIDRAIDVHVRRLRAKIGAYADIVVTYPGMGYGYKI